jgi:multidrug efflux pump subunit AcrA (membrane-fusion protein)
MYARVRLTVERRPSALTVPRNALVDVEGRRGVFVLEDETARFRAVTTGLQDPERVEIVDGVTENQRVITTGALALRDGDRVLLAGDPASPGGRGAGGRGAAGRGGSQPQTPPAPGR